jgi:hypothetical protein
VRRPLANRDEDQLLYIRESAPGLQQVNTTFSVPEIKDLGDGLKTTIRELGTFSEVDFTMVGLGTPRSIPAGVVDGNYFDVMGLKPVLGRLLTPADDGPNAAGAVVLTYGFWRNSLKSDPGVLGKRLRLESFEGARSATVVGVLEPSVPYPVSTEIIANVVTSPHHLSATMVTGREHRMTEVFGRLAPGTTVEAARAELRSVYGAMTSAHPEVYKAASHYAIDVTRMHDQINSKANTVLWILFAASGLLFVIASSNMANLVLARTTRRESELAVRSALARRREFCGGHAGGVVLRQRGGAALILAVPWWRCWASMRSATRCAPKDLSLDFSLVWFGIGLALAAAVFQPDSAAAFTGFSAGRPHGAGHAVAEGRPQARIFTVGQIMISFLLLGGRAC